MEKVIRNWKQTQAEQNTILTEDILLCSATHIKGDSQHNYSYYEKKKKSAFILLHVSAIKVQHQAKKYENVKNTAVM
jgi:hypothetical protein